MTALIAIQNDDYSILLSDRRITVGRVATSDEYGKSGMIYCSDGRFAYSFTGIAQYGNFRMNKWIAETLVRAGKPQCPHKDLILNFKAILNRSFYDIPELKRCPRDEKKITIVFAGHFWDDYDIYARLVVISNFEDFNTMLGYKHPLPEFRDFVQTQDPSSAESYFSVVGFGNWRALNKKHADQIGELVVARKPREAVVGKAITLLRKVADTTVARNNIGKQIDEIFIPHDPRVDPIGKYHTARPTNQVWIPPQINLSGESIRTLPEMVLTATPKAESIGPWEVQKVKKHQPCPCGSGENYGVCHGNQKRRAEGVIRI